MSDQTEIIKKVEVEQGPTAGESKIMSVSVRAWIALLLTMTVCLLSGLLIDIKEPLYTLCTTAIGFYFGNKTSK